ncbi:hypothetical protein ACIBBE_28700 [Streptomyces sp. NPDC051644]|uniref:hypothetical protein n=1 Tax=Streptomyces sp. NPDC051644 TaxID=3365666 RepID=UPI00379381AF
MNNQQVPDEPEVGDEDFLEFTRDQARARALRKQLQQLAGGGAGGVLKEMAQELLSGRVGLREAMRVPAYSEALGERIRTFREAWEQMSPEEQEAQKEGAHRFIEAQNEEIELERATARTEQGLFNKRR